MRAAERVKTKSRLKVVGDVSFPHLPLGVEDVARVPRHPCGEALVQPQTIPEVHGDEVTEPLVSKFVLHNLGNALLGGCTAGLLVKEKVNDTVSDETPVLHGAGREIGNGDHVHLGQGELAVELLLVEFEGLCGEGSGEVAMVNVLVRGAEDADGKAELVGLVDLELTNDECKEVSRHQRGLVEGDGLALLAGHGRVNLLLAGNVHVAQTSHLVVGDEGDSVGGLQCGLVEAGEGSTGVCGLHLGGGHVCILAVGSLVRRAVESSHVVVQAASELVVESGLCSGGDGLIELDLGGLRVLV